jgi:hypothetical protein
LPLVEPEGLRIFDMGLLCELWIVVGQKKTSSRRLQRNDYNQMRPHAAHHTPISCW